MQTHPSITQARQLLQKGNSVEAFELLVQSIPDLPPEYSDDIRLLNTQFHTISRQVVMGLEEGQTKLNKVIYGFLQLLSEMEQEQETTIHTPIEQIVNNTKTFLLFKFHEESIQRFKAAYQQLSSFFNSKTDVEHTIIPISGHIDDLLMLTKKLRALENELEKSRAEFKHVELINMIDQKKTYIQDEMSIIEVREQIHEIDQLMNQLRRLSLKTQSIWGVAILVIIIVVIVLGLLLKNI